MTDQQTTADRPAAVRRSRRMDGIDAARALALIGMLAVHFGPQDGAGLGGLLLWFPHGRASILFAVVAGIGMAFLTADPARRLRGRLRLLCYGLVLLPVGLILEPQDHPVAVILHHYAVFFALGACVAGLKRGTLLSLALVMSVLGPVIFLAGRMAWPSLFDRSTVSIHDDPVTILSGLLFTGPYPLITWSAALLFGFWLGRGNLRAPRAAFFLVLGGLAVAVAAILLSFALFDILGRPTSKGDWRFLFMVAGHSQMPLWLIQATALAAAAVGLSLITARWLPSMTAGFAALGRLTLTVYVAHILMMIVWPDVLVHEDVAAGLWTTGLFSALAVLFAVIWQPLGRGPIERLMHGVWTWVEGLLPERHGEPGGAAERPT